MYASTPEYHYDEAEGTYSVGANQSGVGGGEHEENTGRHLCKKVE